jgi:hypothetical protein
MAITLFVVTPRVKDLDPAVWAEVTDESEISVVVARTAIREIDKLKNDGRERRRAKRARRSLGVSFAQAVAGWTFDDGTHTRF